MASVAHCHYCFESLTAYLEHRKPLPLAKFEELYEKHQRKLHAEADMLSNSVGVPNQVNGNGATANGHVSYTAATSALSNYPLFITWKISKGSRKDLRGCIGTFEPKSLELGLKDYALTAGLRDSRFDPIAVRELPKLECGVTLLTDFEPASGPTDWELGVHGLQIDFVHHSRRMGATYLPDVPTEQGWTKEETLISLMRKAGWTGRRDDWKKIKLSITRYQGSRATVSWDEYQQLLALDGKEDQDDERDLEDGEE